MPYLIVQQPFFQYTVSFYIKTNEIFPYHTGSTIQANTLKTKVKWTKNYHINMANKVTFQYVYIAYIYIVENITVAYWLSILT